MSTAPMTDAELQGKRVAEIADQQGWDDAELLDLAGRFLDHRGLTGQFANFLETIQRAEQKEVEHESIACAVFHGPLGESYQAGQEA